MSDDADPAMLCYAQNNIALTVEQQNINFEVTCQAMSAATRHRVLRDAREVRCDLWLGHSTVMSDDADPAMPVGATHKKEMNVKKHEHLFLILYVMFMILYIMFIVRYVFNVAVCYVCAALIKRPDEIPLIQAPCFCREPIVRSIVR